MVVGLFVCLFPVRKRDFKNTRVGGAEVCGFQEKRQVGMESGRKLKRSPHRHDAPAFLALEGRTVRKHDTGQDN